MPKALFMTCEAWSSGGIEQLSSLEVKQGRRWKRFGGVKEVRAGSGQGRLCRFTVLQTVGPSHSVRSSLQCYGNSGAGWSDLRMWRIRWKLISQLCGVLFSRNKQVRALCALQLIHLFAAKVVPWHCWGSRLEKEYSEQCRKALTAEQHPSLQEFTWMQANKTMV